MSTASTQCLNAILSSSSGHFQTAISFLLTCLIFTRATAGPVALAAVGDDDAGVVSETADLLYHVLLLLRQRGLSLTAVAAELEMRHANRLASAKSAD